MFFTYQESVKKNITKTKEEKRKFTKQKRNYSNRKTKEDKN